MRGTAWGSETRFVLAEVYVALRRLLQLVVLLCRSDRSKELEILLLRDELAILRRQPRRAPVRPVDRALPAALARALPRRAWRGRPDRSRHRCAHHRIRAPPQRSTRRPNHQWEHAAWHDRSPQPHDVRRSWPA